MKQETLHEIFKFCSDLEIIKCKNQQVKKLYHSHLRGKTCLVFQPKFKIKINQRQ